MNLSNLFLKFCEKKEYEINQNQITIIEKLDKFYNQNFNKSFLKKIFKKKITNQVFI